MGIKTVLARACELEPHGRRQDKRGSSWRTAGLAAWVRILMPSLGRESQSFWVERAVLLENMVVREMCRLSNGRSE